MKKILLVLALVLLPALALAASQADVTTNIEGRVAKHVYVDVTSEADGTYALTIDKVDGMVYRVVLDPDGVDAPSADWDVTITDDSEVDILDGNGADLSATATVNDTSTTRAVSGELDIACAGMGNANKCKITFWYMQ